MMSYTTERVVDHSEVSNKLRRQHFSGILHGEATIGGVFSGVLHLRGSHYNYYILES
jgi:hypothetical protein